MKRIDTLKDFNALPENTQVLIYYDKEVHTGYIQIDGDAKIIRVFDKYSGCNKDWYFKKENPYYRYCEVIWVFDRQDFKR